MNGPLLTVDDVWTLLFVGVGAVLAVCLFELLRNGAVAALDRLDAVLGQWRAEDAETFGEPTREQVEADLEADAFWASILRAIDTTPEEFRAAYAATPKTTRD